jgi:RNA polymerase sigma-70 factor (ECF subfamily)
MAVSVSDRPDYAGVPDDQLMELIQSGDENAFAQIVERHQGPLIGFFCTNTHDRALAEDLTQETLLRVYNQAWDYLATGKFHGWLYRIARNLLIDTVRRQRHDALIQAYRGSEEDEQSALARLAEDVASPMEVADQRELGNIVSRLLQDLPEEQRLTFTMHHFSGLSLPEVAEILETSVATTKSRLRLAREKLQEQLAGRGIIELERKPVKNA